MPKHTTGYEIPMQSPSFQIITFDLGRRGEAIEIFVAEAWLKEKANATINEQVAQDYFFSNDWSWSSDAPQEPKPGQTSDLNQQLLFCLL